MLEVEWSPEEDERKRLGRANAISNLICFGMLVLGLLTSAEITRPATFVATACFAAVAGLTWLVVAGNRKEATGSLRLEAGSLHLSIRGRTETWPTDSLYIADNEGRTHLGRRESTRELGVDWDAADARWLAELLTRRSITPVLVARSV